MLEPKNLVKHFEQNLIGRDFVCGDIHGMYDMFMDKLKEIDFDAEKDRIFSCGDVVDRGPNSYECLMLCNEDWFFASMGNHEIMVWGGLHGENINSWELNGGKWGRDLDDGQMRKCLSVLREMPVAIDVKTEKGLIGIVHAQPSRDWNNISSKDEELMILWGTDKIKKNQDWYCDNIDHVYCGHYTLESPETLGNVTFIDTGCGYHEDGFLTMVQIGGFDK